MSISKPNKSEQKREANCKKILDVAESLFSQYGYDGASMSAIAKDAGLPKANVLYYFKSKSNLYQQVLARIATSWNLGLETVSEQDDPAQVLASYIKTKLKLAFDYPHQSRLFVTELIRGGTELVPYIEQETKPWTAKQVALFQSWIDAKTINATDPLHLLFHIWSVTQYYADYQTEALAIMEKPAYDPQDKTRILRSACTVILRGIGLQPPEDFDYAL